LQRIPRRIGFTIVEAVVAVALLGIGISAAIGALGRVISAETVIRERSQMSALAVEKISELRATGDYVNAPLEADFDDSDKDRFHWSADLQPTGVENLDRLSVTVSRVRGGKDSQTVSTLVYHQPAGAGGAQ
jgi:type II secretory pathway pseudopilin PulG